MKKAVYIITAILATAFTILLTLEVIDFINEEYGSLITFHEEMFWLSIARYLIMAITSLVFAALSLIQIKRSTPKLILILSGYAFFSSTSFVFAEEWWVSTIYLIAGLLPAVYELIKYGRLVKPMPFQRQRYDGMLIAAGVLSCLCIAFRIYSVISDRSLNRLGSDFIASVYYSAAVGVMQYICTAIFCFLKCRRTGVLYRMFFIGSSAIGFLLFIVNIVDIIIMEAGPGYLYMDPLLVVGSVVSLTPTMLILNHAFRTRHDGILPQEPAALPQQQTEMHAM